MKRKVMTIFILLVLALAPIYASAAESDVTGTSFFEVADFGRCCMDKGTTFVQPKTVTGSFPPVADINLYSADQKHQFIVGGSEADWSQRPIDSE